MNKKQLFENFVTQNIDGAYRFAYSYMKNREDAEDIVNESVIKALKSISSLRDTTYIKPWFYKIIVNTALTSIRRKSKRSTTPYEEAECPLTVEDDYSNLTFESLTQLLEPKYREIIILRFCEKMSLIEIADVLQLNENTVKTRLYTAIKTLKINLQEELIHE